jgi:hypothetical protein
LPKNSCCSLRSARLGGPSSKPSNGHCYPLSAQQGRLSTQHHVARS